MPKIAIVDKIHQDGINLLKNNSKFECEIIEDLSKKNLISKLPAFDGITLRRGKIDAEILEKCKKLKVISRHGVGFDNVDIKYLKKNNIKLLVTSTTTSVLPPTRQNRCSLTALTILPCVSIGKSQISSKYNVPRCACSNKPTTRRWLWRLSAPNNSASTRSVDNLAQLATTNRS